MQKLRLRLIAIVAAVSACGGGSQLIIGPEVLTYSAATRVTSASPMQFETTVTVRNGTSDPVDFLLACPTPRVLVYSSAARTGTPVWDSNSRAVVCIASVTPVTLAPGQSGTYTLVAPGTEVLGATGTPGPYFVAAEVRLSGFDFRMDAGTVNLAR